MMDTHEIAQLELPAIAEIVASEARKESRRRKRKVSRHDPVVQQLVADVLLGGAGQKLRQQCGAAQCAGRA